MKYMCATCGATVEPLDDDMILSRGYLWHRPCVTLEDDDIVAFPSPGKLLPVSILRTEPEPTPTQTHYAECWRDPERHACAVAEIERLTAENEQLKAQNRRLDEENDQLRDEVDVRQDIIEDFARWVNGVVSAVKFSNTVEHIRAKMERLRKENEERNSQ